MHRGIRRKLLTPKGAADVMRLAELGVPIQKIIRDYSLPVSAPTLKRLIKAHIALAATNDAELQSRLFPSWLDLTEGNSCIQDCPEDWYYDGYFPLTGGWRRKNENN